MGSDDERWEPKPTKPKIKPDINNSNYKNGLDLKKPGYDDYPSLNKNDLPTNKSLLNYQVTLNGDKRTITASNLDEIIQNIRNTYDIGNKHQFRINYWSDTNHEWVFLDSFPPNRTKLQVILTENNDKPPFLKNVKTEQDFNAIIRHEITKYLEQPLNFCKHLNQSCKYCLDTNKQPDLLNYFETSIHYINKRYNQNHAAPTKQLLQLQDNQQKLIDKLIADTDVLRNENRELKQQIDELSKEIERFKDKTTKKSSGSKTRCSIM